MTDTIEAVARAICVALDGDPNAKDVFDGHYQWKDFIDVAWVVIAAYRQAVASEAAGKQRRYKLPNGTWSDWLTSDWLKGLNRFDSNFVVEERDVFAALPAPIPAGWKLVPLDPDEAMTRAGNAQAMSDEAAFGSAVYSADSIYAAMLEAAPTPEAPNV